MLKAMFKIFHEGPSRREDFEILHNTELKKPLYLSSLPCTEKENVGQCKVSWLIFLAKPRKASETNKIKFGLYYKATAKVCWYHSKLLFVNVNKNIL